jgi:hypothetical protein
MEIVPDDISSNHHCRRRHRSIDRHQMKQFRHEFIRQWTADARQTGAQQHAQHVIHSHDQRTTDTNEEKYDRERNRTTHSCRPATSSSEDIDRHRTYSTSTIVSSRIERKRQHMSSNNSATSRFQSTNANENNIECKLS